MKKNEEQYNKFWFGFAVGSAFCGLCAMAVGTKQGRQFVKKSIDYMESVDGTPDQVHKLTDTIQQFTRSLMDDAGTGKTAQTITNAVVNVVEELVDAPSEKPAARKKPAVKDDSSLNSIIDKMRNFSSGKKTDARFFKKPKK